MIILIIFNTFLFTQTNHPISIGLILLTQTLLSCLLSGIITKRFWFSYILFLIFIGGILILFIYMSSLAANEKINFSPSFIIKLSIIFIITIPIIILDKFYIINIFNNSDTTPDSNILIIINENIITISKIYDKPNNLIIILLINYLLLTLIVIVKITNTFMGPLRPKYQ